MFWRDIAKFNPLHKNYFSWLTSLELEKVKNYLIGIICCLRKLPALLSSTLHNFLHYVFLTLEMILSLEIKNIVQVLVESPESS